MGLLIAFRGTQPENILVHGDTAKMVDFGDIAKVAELVSPY